MTSPMFWTDSQQASERLTNTFILYGDSPSYVDGVRGNGERSTAVIRTFPDGATHEKLLSDPLFHRFRKLPPTGWMNCLSEGAAVYTERRPVRSRQHGLSRQNVRAAWIHSERGELNWGDFNYESLAKDDGYKAAVVGDFPTLAQVFDNLRERGVMAISTKYAVFRDPLGIRWLYRNNEKIGMFSDANSLMVAGTFKYLKEELAADPAVAVNNIQEF